MKFRLPGATAIAAIMVALAAPAPLAFAQNGGAAPAVTVSRDVVQPLNEARNAVIAKDWATAKTKLDAATAKAKTPADKAQIERLRLVMAAETKDGKQQVASINTLIASGTLTTDEVKQYKGALAKAHAEAGDTAASLVAFRAYIDEYGGTPDQLMAIANDSSKANDHATTVVYATKAIAASKAASGKPPESWHRLLMRAYQQQNLTAEFYGAVEQALVDYPTEQNWKILIARVQEEPRFTRATHLDLYRTLMAAGVKLTTQEKSQAIREALVSRGLPNEALELLEPAVASGELSSQEDKDNLAKARARSAEDKSGLAKETKDALAKNDASYIAKLGEAHMSYGDNARAVEVLQAALAKGIADPDEAAFARLHLGIAQFRAGQADAARATWAEVKSDNGATVLAKNWTLISKIKT
jgi:tetratricopeptide (TPR) repeat protein